CTSVYPTSFLDQRCPSVPARRSSDLRGVRRLTGTDHAAQVDALQVGARVHAARVEPRGPGDIESAWVHRQRQVRDLESVPRKGMNGRAHVRTPVRIRACRRTATGKTN